MQIEFFEKTTGRVLQDTDSFFFVMNSEVYCDNSVIWESQEAAIGFEDCIKRRPDIGWRLKSTLVYKMV